MGSSSIEAARRSKYQSLTMMMGCKRLKEMATQRHADTLGRALSNPAMKDAIAGIFGSRFFSFSGVLSAETVEGTKQKRSSIEFGRERNAYEKDLSSLRKKWLAEVNAKKMKEDQERESLRRAQEERREERAKVQAERTARMAMELDGQAQKIEAARKQKISRRIENVSRESARQSVIAAFREKRKEVLLEQSKNWIATESELEAKIDEAVENPEPLWISEKVARK